MTVYKSEDEPLLLAIRRTIIVAIASDDELMDRLVLKGGNALDLVYRLGERSSLDVDFSMSADFGNTQELNVVRERLFRALRDRFDSIGFVVFDERLEPRPANAGPGLAVWGGYTAKFKLISSKRFVELGGIPGIAPDATVANALRQQSQVVGIGGERNFTIEISKFEYCDGRILQQVDGYEVYVYTPAMIAIEKLRAICQQLPEYKLRRNPTPRPRDFFDIYTIVTGTGCDLASPEHEELARAIFAVKEVPLEFLELINRPSVRDFHAQQWPAVTNAVRGSAPRPFEFYFNFVVTQVQRLLQSRSESR